MIAPRSISTLWDDKRKRLKAILYFLLYIVSRYGSGLKLCFKRQSLRIVYVAIPTLIVLIKEALLNN